MECIIECLLFLFTFHSVRSGESRPRDRGISIALRIQSLDPTKGWCTISMRFLSHSLIVPIIYVRTKLRETVLICGKLIPKAAWLIHSAHHRHHKGLVRCCYTPAAPLTLSKVGKFCIILANYSFNRSAQFTRNGGRCPPYIYTTMKTYISLK